MAPKPSYAELELQVNSLLDKIQGYEQKISTLTKDTTEITDNHSYSLLEAVFEQAPFPIALVATDGTLLNMNSACAETLKNQDIQPGINISEANSRWRYFDVNGDRIPFEQLPLLKALQGKETKNMEIRVLNEQNQERWEIVTSSPIYDRNGKLIAGFLTFPDITERKKVEIQLQESEIHYRKLFDNASISIWNEDLSEIYAALEQLQQDGISDLDNYLKNNPEFIWKLVSKVKVTDVNAATLKLFGVDSKDSFLTNIGGVFGEDAILVFIEELKAIWDKKPYFISKANYLTTDNEQIKALISFAVPQKKADFANVVVTIQDITELDYQQDRLDALVDALPDITFILDEDGKYLEILTSRYELLYDEMMKLKGNSIHNVLPNDKAKFFINTIRQAITSGEKQVVQYELDVPVGRVWFEGRVSPMHTTFKNKKAVVWVAVDITEHKKMELQLRQSQKMEAIGILTGGIAHEFNNLLTPILGYAELFLGETDKQNENYVGFEQIFKGSVRAKDLVQQLLAYSRQSMSMIETMHLSDLVRDTVELIKNTIPANIKISTDIETDLPAISGMPNEIHQVILNLCINASHALIDGGELLIALDKHTPEKINKDNAHVNQNEYIRLTVKDTGIGMDLSTQECIFDPFFTTKDIGKGTGLGLSVVQGIVEQHKGFIEVDSNVGKGSSFYVYLPITQENIDTKPELGATLLMGCERILLVDDEQMVIDISKTILSRLGYKVTGFTHSEVALDKFTQQPEAYDLIITDYGMLNMNGKEFVEKIKHIKQDIPIILITGYGDMISKKDIKSWGMNALLRKPFTSMEIGKAVRKVLS